MRLVMLVLGSVGCVGSLTPLVDSTEKVDDAGDDDGLHTGSSEADADVDADADADVDTDADTDTPGVDTIDTGTPGPTTTPWVCPDASIPAGGLLSGNTTGQGNDDSGSCGGGSSADLHLSFTAPSAGRYLFDLDGTSYDSVLYVLDGCGGPELACQDVSGSEQILLQLAASQQAIVVVDGAGGASGAYDLSVTAIPNTETSCGNGIDDDLDGPRDCADSDCVGTAACTESCTNGTDDDLDGLVDCADSDCTGHPACAEVCTDGADNDFDGYTDCADSDCAGVPACTESCANGTDDDLDGLVDCLDPDCFGTGACTESCSNGTDDDGDGLVDCLDSDCTSVAACVAPCADATFLPPLPDTIVGNTNSAVGDYSPGCVSTSNAPDFEFDFVAPSSGVYTFDTFGSSFDTVIYAIDGCAGVELACNDDAGVGLQSEINLYMTIGERVVIVVDGYGTASGPMTVTAN